jgi:DNA replication protein DnaC
MERLSDALGIAAGGDDAPSSVEKVCNTHGPYISTRIVGTRFSRCPACQKLLAEHQEQQQKKRIAEEFERRMEGWLGRAAIPTRFIGRTFDTFNATTPEQKRALSVLREYAEDFDANAKRGTGLILTGKPGTGKSHLAASVLQSLPGRYVMYATCLDLIRMVRETWRKDSHKSEREVLNDLGGLELLVIDEMGVQYGTDGEQTILFDVLDLRYRNVKPTILLTNQDSEGLKSYLGERSFDRLRETCRLVAFDWESYRPQARKEQA